MFFLLIPVILALLVTKVIKICRPDRKVSLRGKHVVVTGGSSGIGKAIAILAAKQGAHVTILARNIDKLVEAQKEIQKYAVDEEQQIVKVSVDIINFEDVENNLHEVEAVIGPIYMLINCAGMAICGEVENLTPQQIKSLVNVNFLGTLYAIQAMVPKFKERKEGIFVLTASQLALMGMYGMSVYAACKFALRGLAESLYMELKDYNISITLALPPDTDTPGFETENQSKPLETKLMSEAAGLHKPEDVAQKIMDDALVSRIFMTVSILK